MRLPFERGKDGDNDNGSSAVEGPRKAGTNWHDRHRMHPFHAALCFGDLIRAKQELASWRKEQAEKDTTALYEPAAARRGRRGRKSVSLLHHERNGWTGLHFAALSGEVALVDWLLGELEREQDTGDAREAEVGADTTLKGETALHIASAKGHEAVARALLQRKAVVGGEKDHKGRTALHHAVEAGDLATVKVLVIEGKLSPAELDNEKQAPALIALSNGRTTLVNYFLEVCPNLANMLKRRNFKPTRGVGSIAPPMALAGPPRTVGVGIATKAAAVVTSSTASVSSSPSLLSASACSSAGYELLTAARSNDKATIVALLDSGRVHVDWVGKNGWTALMEASAGGQQSTVSLLLQRGCSVNMVNKKGMNALQLAVKAGHLHIVDDLLKVKDTKGKADVKSRAGQCLRCLASGAGHSYLADWLYAMGIGGCDGCTTDCVFGDGHEVDDYVADMRRVSTSGSPSTPGSTVTRLAVPEIAGNEASGLLSSHMSSPAGRGPGGGGGGDGRKNRVGDVTGGPPPFPTSVVGGPCGDLQMLSFAGTSPALMALRSWLIALHLSEYEERLIDNGFDALPLLTTVTEDDLSEMGFKKGHRRAFLHGVQGLTGLMEPTALLQSCCTTATVTTTATPPSATSGGGYLPSIAPSKLVVVGEPTVPALAEPTGEVTEGKERSASTDERGIEVEFEVAVEVEVVVPNLYDPAQELEPCPLDESCDGTDIDGGGGGDDDEIDDATNSWGKPMFKELSLDEVELGVVIGEGSFGIVRKGVWRGMTVAVKQLKAADMGDIRHEAQVLARVCNHSCIIQFCGVLAMADSNDPCVVTRYMENGSVEELLVGSDYPVALRLVKRMAIEATMGVLHLHREGVVHRDLAARNLLVDDSFHVRITDFGFSRVKQTCASKGYTTTCMGPIKWTAPEAMRKRCYSEQSDAFSFGVVLYEMFTRKPPWAEHQGLEVAFKVCSGARMHLPETLDALITNLIKQCWSQKPAERPDMATVLQVLTWYAECGTTTEMIDAPPPLASAANSPPQSLLINSKRRNSMPHMGDAAATGKNASDLGGMDAQPRSRGRGTRRRAKSNRSRGKSKGGTGGGAGGGGAGMRRAVSECAGGGSGGGNGGAGNMQAGVAASSLCNGH